MKRISIDVDPNIFRTIKILAATQGITIREYVTSLIEKDLGARKESE